MSSTNENLQKIKIAENDRVEFSLVLSGLNVAMDMIRSPLDPQLSPEEVEVWYDALMTHFKTYKIQEHNLRCQFMEKYKVPYNFFFKDGQIAEQAF